MKHRYNKQNKNIMYSAIAIIVILLLAGAIYYSNLPLPKTASVVTSVTLANVGEVKDGKLIGSKYFIAATLSSSDTDILISLKDSQKSFGQHTIIPQKNMLIKAKSQGSYARSPLEQYQSVYYKGVLENLYQLSSLKGSLSWEYRTPYIVNVYADSNNVPITLVSSKYVNEIGQALTPISDSGIGAKQSSIAFIGPQDLPRPSDLVVATAPDYSEMVGKTGIQYMPTTYIFDRASFDSKVNYFYEAYGTMGLGWLNDPAMALWTGYDPSGVFSSFCGITSKNYVNGYCKLNGWDGLYKEVARPGFDLSYNSGTNSLRANNIQYSSNIVLEIPSEMVESLAILRGVGTPEILAVDAPGTIRSDSSPKIMTVTVRNNGDTDGFNIQPISKSGKLIFTPNSHTSQQIESTDQGQFKFLISVAGKEASEINAKEDVAIEVRANNNPVKTTKNVQIGIEYVSQPPGQPSVDPTSTSTMPGVARGETKAWYEMWQTWIVVGLFLLLGYFMYDDNQKKNKKKR